LLSHREKYTLGIHQKSILRLHWTHGSDEWDRALVGIKILCDDPQLCPEI